MKDKIPAQFQDPLAITTNASVWAYNTEVYDECPVKNLWELTEPEWKGKVAFYDPLSKPTYPDWFNQTEMHHDDEMAAAYEAQFGKELDRGEESATRAWVKAFAANGPLLTDSRRRDLRGGRAPGPEGAVLRPPELGQVPRQRRQGLQARALQGSRAVAGLDLRQARADRDRHRQPERGEALHPLHPDRGGHRAAGDRRQAADQSRHRPAARTSRRGSARCSTSSSSTTPRPRSTTGTCARTGRTSGASTTRSETARAAPLPPSTRVSRSDDVPRRDRSAA